MASAHEDAFEALASPSLFAAFGEAGTYYPPASSSGTASTWIRSARRSDTLNESGATRTAHYCTLRVRASEVAQPERNGRVAIGSDEYALLNSPTRLADVWSAEAALIERTAIGERRRDT